MENTEQNNNSDGKQITAICDQAQNIQRQLELEDQMIGYGVEQYNKIIAAAREDKRESRTTYGRKLTAHYLEHIATGVQNFLDISATGAAARRAIAAKHLREIDSRVLSLITLQTVLDRLTDIDNATLTTVALAIGKRVEDEVRHIRFCQQAPQLYKKLTKQVKESTTYRHKRKVLSHAATQAELENMPEWTQKTKLHVGMKLFDILYQETPLVEVNERQYLKTKGKSTKFVSPTEELMEWISEYNARCEVLKPCFLPMLEKPRPWQNTSSGGYLKAEILNAGLIKHKHKIQEEILSGSEDQIHAVYDSVNKVQETAWKINPDVYRVAKTFWDNQNGGVAKLPPRNNKPLPVKPTDIDTNELSLKKWKGDASRIHEFNNKQKSGRLQVSKIFWVADKFAKEDRFYFPYQLDFRGRMYPRPLFLNPQGRDLAKGLLTFADGVPIEGFEAVGWLAIHGANCYGYDKAPLRDRIKFIEDLSEQIKATAKDPYADLWWTKVDKPFCFLAFCFEWAGFLETGLGYVSHLPVAMDASCSGIQHFSAMLKDEVGGTAVNLTPSDTKADIYQEVCNVFIGKLTEKVSSKEIAFTQREDEKEISEGQLAQWWLDLEPDRTTTKRQVMVLPYGGTPHSCRDYTQDWVLENRIKDIQWKHEDMFQACKFASDLLWSSINEVIVGARKVMDWLQECAKVASKDDKPLVWTTPLGFPVVHWYPKYKDIRVKTKLGESQIQINLREEGVSTAKANMKSSIAPNFVHSLDATHMMLSVLYASDNDVKSFATVHDSFSTHAAHAPKLAEAVRETFYHLYQNNDVLQNFRNELAFRSSSEVAEKLPKLLPRGELDLSRVRQSDFFFS